MWSFHIYYSFDMFLDFLHQTYVELQSGTLCTFIIYNIEISSLGFSDINRGSYLVEFYLFPLQQQLTLFPL